MGIKRPALKCATVGIMAAALECVKLALSFIPNVEAVTLFSAVFGYCFGTLGVIALVIFVLIEPLIWGFGTWVVSYIIYWPMLTLIFALLGARRRKKELDGDIMKERAGGAYPTSLVILVTCIAVVMTFLFGVLTSLVEVGLFSGAFDNFLFRFAIYYARGVWFYLAQIITNLVAFPLLFVPLTRTALRIKLRM